MSKLVVIGESERYNGFEFGKYKIDLDILAEINDLEETRNELLLLTNSKSLSSNTVDLLFKIAHELENFKEVI